MADTDVRERYGPGDPNEAVIENTARPALAVADPAPLGLAAFALTTFMLSGHNAGFIPDIAWVGLALFYGGRFSCWQVCDRHSAGGRLTGRRTVRKTDGLRITGRGKPQLIQVFAVRPHLTRRSNRILAGAYAPRSNGHHVYIALEAVKVIALLTTGILLLSST